MNIKYRRDDTLSITSDSTGEDALHITKVDGENLYVNFPSSSYLLKPDNSVFTLSINDLSFDITGLTPTASQKLFEDTGYIGESKADASMNNVTVSYDSNYKILTKSGDNPSFDYVFTLSNTDFNVVEFNYKYKETNNNTFNLCKLDGTVIYTFDLGDLSNDTLVKFIIYRDKVHVFFDDEYESSVSVTLPYSFKTRFIPVDKPIYFNKFKAYRNLFCFSDKAVTSDYNSNYDVQNTDSKFHKTIDTTGTKLSVDTEGYAEVYPTLNSKTTWLSYPFQLDTTINNYSSNAGICVYTSKFSTRKKYKLSDIGVPSSGGDLRITYDGNKLTFLVNNDTEHKVTESIKLGESIAIGFYIGSQLFNLNLIVKDALTNNPIEGATTTVETSTSEDYVSFKDLNISQKQEVIFNDSGFNAVPNTLWDYDTNKTERTVTEDNTSFTSKATNLIARVTPISNTTTKTPLYLQGESILQFNYKADNSDATGNYITIKNSLGAIQHKICLSDLYQTNDYLLLKKYKQDQQLIDDTKESKTWTDNQSDYYRVGVIKNTTNNTVTYYTSATETQTIDMQQVKNRTTGDITYYVPEEVLDNLYNPYKTFYDVQENIPSHLTTILNKYVTLGILDSSYNLKDNVKNATFTSTTTDCVVKCEVGTSNFTVKKDGVTKITEPLNFQQNTKYYYQLREERRNGKFTYTDLSIYNDLYAYPFSITCRGFDERGKVYCNNNIDMGVYEEIETVTPSNKDTTCKVCFSDVPDTVKYIDFVIKLSGDIPSLTLGKLMLYEGDYNAEYQTDHIQKNKELQEINFTRNFYANLYNDGAVTGLSVIRPNMDSFKTKQLTESNTTILYPYLQEGRDEDNPSNVSIEYLKSLNQTIDISWDR